MTYSPSIPGPNDLISSSQSQIQTNFSQADTAFAVNHVAFSTLADQGKHRRVDFLRVAAPGSSANTAVVYQKAGPTSSELFMQRDAVGTEIQLTRGIPVNAQLGTSFLPGSGGAMLMNWGLVTIATGATKSVAAPGNGQFATAFTGNVFVIILTPTGGVGPNATANFASTGAIGPTSFEAFRSGTGNAVVYHYVAIGN